MIPDTVAVKPVSGTVPSTVLPRRNCTEPVGVPAPGGVTDTVAVAICPFTLSATAVAALFTTNVGSSTNAAPCAAEMAL